MKKAVLSCALFISFTTSAASFDCTKARSADEKAICTNLMLNDKDVEMTTTYRLLCGLFAMGTQGDMQDAQQAWLNHRRQCGGNITCLTNAYNSRLQQLNAMYLTINKPL
ncbi:hypothetical protein [Pseudescherichia sp.]|uniref:lysozyme inhibitor LprI family protein n=1 Tax=Pseudescherichia sp. TaxID=2055881 RepID=UPI002897612F|nr:hypothetical protein [Pseudescherichia sp.]